MTLLPPPISLRYDPINEVPLKSVCRSKVHESIDELASISFTVVTTGRTTGALEPDMLKPQQEFLSRC